jgi:hypothetical protein
MTGQSDAVISQHPKDSFISDWKTLPESKRAEFSNELIDRLFRSGFSVLNKKEVELTVLALLEEAGALGTRTNHELSLALGITETRVRNLMHAARLRHGISDEDYLRSRLPALLTKMSPELTRDADGTERIRFVVEDALLQQALNARIKAAGGTPETGHSKEICSVKLDTFTDVVFQLIPPEQRDDLKKKLGKDWMSKLKGLLKTTFASVVKEPFKKAILAGETPALVAAWNLLTPHAQWAEHLLKVLGAS